MAVFTEINYAFFGVLVLCIFNSSRQPLSGYCLVALLFNSRTAKAGAIIGLLLVFFISSRFLLRPYDVTTTSNLLFVHSFMQFQLKCVRNVIFRY